MKKFAADAKLRNKFATGGSQLGRDLTADIEKSIFPLNILENAVTVNQGILKDNLAVVIGQPVIGDDITFNKFLE